MINPILEKLQQSNELIKNVNDVKQMLQGKNTNEIAFNLMKNNPQFRQFYETNKDKTVEQIANAYGLDMGLIKSLL